MLFDLLQIIESTGFAKRLSGSGELIVGSKVAGSKSSCVCVCVCVCVNQDGTHHNCYM